MSRRYWLNNRPLNPPREWLAYSPNSLSNLSLPSNKKSNFLTYIENYSRGLFLAGAPLTLVFQHKLPHCPKIWNIYSQKWNCAAMFPIYTLMYRWGIYIFPRLVLGRPIMGICKSFTDHECGNWETEHYNSVLETTRLHRFISGNT